MSGKYERSFYLNGKKLKKLISESEYSQADIINKVGIGRTTLHYALSRNRMEKWSAFDEICQLLDIDPHYVTDDIDMPLPYPSDLFDEADLLSDYINRFIAISNKQQNKDVKLTPTQHIAVAYHLSKYTTDVINIALECPDDLNPMDYISKHFVVKKK